MVYQVSLLFGIELSWKLSLFVFAGAVSSYNFHWYLTPPEAENASAKVAWNISNRQIHFVLAVIGLLTAGIAALQLLAYWPWLLLTGAVTFLYSAPKIPHPVFGILRRIAVAKTIYLAFAWTLITAFLPLLISETDLTIIHLWYFLNRFFFIYAICILFDYRDVAADRKAGIRSLITLFSEKGVDRLFLFSILLAIVFQFLLSVAVPAAYTIALLLPMVILILLYRKAKRNFSDYLYYFVLDGLMMLAAPLLVLAKFAR